jgi:hypothetical protein
MWMRRVIAAILVLVAGLFAANMLGVAAAEAPTTTSLRTISVEGVANVPLAQGANLATSTAAYRQGMAAAVTDGQGKAEFLASKVSATLGSVQSITEDGGSISCTGSEEGESRYAEFTGEQPDFGTATSPVEPYAVAEPESAASGAPATAVHPALRGKKRKKHHAAKAAAVVNVTCTLSAQVSLVYPIS